MTTAICPTCSGTGYALGCDVSHPHMCPQCPGSGTVLMLESACPGLNASHPDRALRCGFCDPGGEDEPDTRVACPHCGELHDADDINDYQTARQTHWEPAEYETFCPDCLPAKFREPDPDRYRD